VGARREDRREAVAFGIVLVVRGLVLWVLIPVTLVLWVALTRRDGSSIAGIGPGCANT